MRQLLLLGTWTFIGVTMIVIGVALLLPGRFVLGDRRHEREMASCMLADESEVKLYQGDSTATTPAWYSVTHNPPGLQPERQILYRDEAPALYDLFCDSTGVVVRTDSLPITLTAQQTSELREQPRGMRPRAMLRWAIGGALVLLGSALLWFLRPRRGDEAAV